MTRVWPKENKLLKWNGQFAGEVAEVAAHHLARESVVPRRHGSVRGENISRRHDLQGGIEIEIFLCPQNPDALQREEGGVAFVHVENLRADPELTQSPHTADSQHHLLPDAHLEIAAVKLGRDQTILGRVLRHVGVEEVKIDPADVQLPDLGVNLAVENLDRDEDARVIPAHFAERQVMEILIQADGLLGAIAIDLLLEITVPIKQPDGDEVQIQIAGRFAMIAGKNAEAAGVVRDGFVEAELRREISDWALQRAAVAFFAVGIGPGQVGAERFVHGLQLAQEIIVLRHFFQPRLPRKLEHADGVVIRPIPEFRVEMAEEAARGRFPRPPDIKDDLAKRLERGGEGGNDVVGVIRRHGKMGCRRQWRRESEFCQ